MVVRFSAETASETHVFHHVSAYFSSISGQKEVFHGLLEGFRAHWPS